MKTGAIPSLEAIDLKGRTVMLRVDLNVPMQAGRVTDMTRIQRALPGIRMLAERGAKVVLISHFGRPEGRYTPSMSLAPLVDTLQDALPGIRVRFGVDCVGPAAQEAVARTGAGEVLLLENLRFHPEEETGEEAFARGLAALGDVYVNDAFSCSHRAHASVSGLPKFLPAYLGPAMREEIEALDAVFAEPERPVIAVVGGSKVSTKLAVLEHLVARVDHLVIGGAMAHCFLRANGHTLGQSLCERDTEAMSHGVLEKAKATGCAVHLPVDLVVTESLGLRPRCRVVPVDAVPENAIALDVGPRSMLGLSEVMAAGRTLVWNGPLGAFESAPYDNSTVFLARIVASLTEQGSLRSVAGGGDTIAALSHAGLAQSFSYCSTAGGAFLEWLEGRELPGIAALRKAA